MRRDPYAESTDYAKFYTLARNVRAQYGYVCVLLFIHEIFVFVENGRRTRLCVCVMGNILIVTGRRRTLHVRYTHQLGRFLPEKPIVLPDIWLMSRDLQKRPAAYLCVLSSGKNNRWGPCGDFRWCLMYMCRYIHKERIEMQLRAHCTHIHAIYLYAGELLRIRN